MKALCIGILLMLGLLLPAGAQSFYVASGTGQGLNKVTISPTGCIIDTVYPCSLQTYFAIARTGNTLYFTSNTQLFKATIVNDRLTNCQVADATPVSMTSLACDINGIIYSARLDELYSWDPAGGGFQLLGKMPYYSAGDIIFYQGELYMASTVGIVKVDVANPAASTLHIPMPGQAIFGLAALPVDCSTTKVYAFETTDAGLGTNMIEVDLPTQQIVNIACTLPFGVADAASEAEGGNVSAILIKEIKLTPQCQEPGKGTIRVIRQPGLSTYTYTLNGSITNTTGVFEHLDPGPYQIRISTGGNCNNQKDTSVLLPLFNEPPPAVVIQQQAPDCLEGGKVWFRISPDNGTNKVIVNNTDTLSAGYLFKDLAEGAYRFRIVDEFFCDIDEKNIVLSFEGRCDTVFFPTAFTPDNNGRNDVFRGSGNRSLQHYQLTVYNRWGETVFTSRDIRKGWNGRVRNVEQAAGVYAWMASYTTKEGIRKQQKGTVVLLR